MLCTEWASEHKKDCGNDSGGPNFNPPTIEQQFGHFCKFGDERHGEDCHSDDHDIANAVYLALDPIHLLL
jgi:hypothetical protein